MLIPYEVARYFTGTDTVKEIFFKMADLQRWSSRRPSRSPT